MGRPTGRIGVDLGGTKTEAVVFDADNVAVATKRVPTPGGAMEEDRYAAIVDAIVDLVADVQAESGVSGSIGIGIPGSESPTTGLIRNANTVALNGRALRADLNRAFGREVRLANDADCFALSEATDGAGAGHRVVFGVIIGTGVGGGVVVDGELLTGVNGVAGEWGHNPMPPVGENPATACWCGRIRCIEQYLSGPALAAAYRDRGGSATRAEDVVAAAAHDDAAAAALTDYAERLAAALGTVINLLDPDVIVLGGGVSNVDVLYDEVPERWSRFVFSDAVGTRLVRAAHGDSGGVRGAAWLWPFPSSEPDT